MEFLGRTWNDPNSGNIGKKQTKISDGDLSEVDDPEQPEKTSRRAVPYFEENKKLDNSLEDECDLADMNEFGNEDNSGKSVFAETKLKRLKRGFSVKGGSRCLSTNNYNVWNFNLETMRIRFADYIEETTPYKVAEAV